MKKIVSLLVFLSIALGSHAQEKKELEPIANNAAWFEGKILLDDGKELKGVVQYNDQTGVLSFQDGTDKRVFTARSVVRFDFFDERYQKNRFYYALKYEDAQANIKRPLFFEFVKEYAEFAILLKADPVEIEQKNRGVSKTNDPAFPVDQWGGVVTVLKQDETIYIMDANGEIIPYLKLTHKDVKGRFGMSSKGTKKKLEDKDLLEKYVTPPLYKKLKEYAKENHLSFKKKDDLFKILDYYESLSRE